MYDVHQCSYVNPIVYLAHNRFNVNKYIQKYITDNYGWTLSTLAINSIGLNVVYTTPNLYLTHLLCDRANGPALYYLRYTVIRKPIFVLRCVIEN